MIKLPKMYRSVGMYIQGPGEIWNLYTYAQRFGKRFYILIDIIFCGTFDIVLDQIFSHKELYWILEWFEGEITQEKILVSIQNARANEVDAVIGIGGGKTLDSAKAIADALSIRQILVPTLAASDAAVSSLSIIYSQNSKKREVRHCQFNPDLVLVDSDIIIKAPRRYLVAGMGDAIATYYEARAVYESGGKNSFETGYQITKLSMMVAKLCCDLILENGEAALAALENKNYSVELEHVIEANILLSGMGFQNTGCAGAHSISAGLSAVCPGQLHGEKVAFGTLCQLILEQRAESEIKALCRFFLICGLPITLSDLDIKIIDTGVLKKIASGSMEDTFWINEPFKVNMGKVLNCIKETDRFGTAFKISQT